MERPWAILLTEFVHHPQFGPACIHSPHDLAFAFKHLFSSVRTHKEETTLLEVSRGKIMKNDYNDK